MVAMDHVAPFGSGNTEANWREFMRRMVVSGVIREVDGEMRVFADSTGMQVKIDPGEVVIEGHWGKIASQKILPISSANPSNPRFDLVVARARFDLDKVEYTVINGTPATFPLPPSMTRDATTWDIPLALVLVGAGVSTITSASVRLCREWGGMTPPTVVDDFRFYGDKLSTGNRHQVVNNIVQNSGIAYFTRVQAIKPVRLTRIRTFCSQAGASSPNVRIYWGQQQPELKNFVDANSGGWSFNSTGMKETTLSSPITLYPGARIVVWFRLSSGTSIGLAGYNDDRYTTYPLTNFFNPNTARQVMHGFKSHGGSPPSTLNILDGSWTMRDRYPWFALL